jgi:hypothetical protein
MNYGERLHEIGRYVLAVTICGIYAYLIWDYSAQHTRGNIEAEYASREYANDTNQQIRDKCLRLADAGLRDCIEKIVKTSREQQRGERDLNAQESMAYWTRLTGAAAALGVLLSVIGIYLIWATLRETRNAVINASTTNSLMLSSQRPWIEILDCTVTGETTWGGGEKKSVRLDIKLMKHGKMPISELRHKAHFSADNHPIAHKQAESIEIPPTTKHIFSGDGITISDCQITVPITKGSSGPGFSIYVEYDFPGGFGITGKSYFFLPIRRPSSYPITQIRPTTERQWAI